MPGVVPALAAFSILYSLFSNHQLPLTLPETRSGTDRSTCFALPLARRACPVRRSRRHERQRSCRRW